MSRDAHDSMREQFLNIQANSFQGEATIGGIPFSQWMAKLTPEEREAFGPKPSEKPEPSDGDDAA